jgi:hypothetical protein
LCTAQLQGLLVYRNGRLAAPSIFRVAKPLQKALRCASKHLWWGTLWGGLFGDDGRYDAFATLMEVRWPPCVGLGPAALRPGGQELPARLCALWAPLQILRVRLAHPSVPPERYREVDEHFRRFAACELGVLAWRVSATVAIRRRLAGGCAAQGGSCATRLASLPGPCRCGAAAQCDAVQLRL